MEFCESDDRKPNQRCLLNAKVGFCSGSTWPRCPYTVQASNASSREENSASVSVTSQAFRFSRIRSLFFEPGIGTTFGLASSDGKAHIHSGGTGGSMWGGEQDAFLEAMGDAGKSVSDYLGSGERIV